MQRTCERVSTSVSGNCNGKLCPRNRRKRACEGSCVHSSQDGDGTTDGAASQVCSTDLVNSFDGPVRLPLLIDLSWAASMSQSVGLLNPCCCCLADRSRTSLCASGSPRRSCSTHTFLTGALAAAGMPEQSTGCSNRAESGRSQLQSFSSKHLRPDCSAPCDSKGGVGC